MGEEITRKDILKSINTFENLIVNSKITLMGYEEALKRYREELKKYPEEEEEDVPEVVKEIIEVSKKNE